MDPRRRSAHARTPGAWRVASALLALLALGAGAVGFHADGAEHAVVAAPAGVTAATVQACAGDHPARGHYETQRPVERDDCAVCLHRLLHQGENGTTGFTAAPAAAAGHLAAPRFDPRHRPLDRSPSRGPPAA